MLTSRAIASGIERISSRVPAIRDQLNEADRVLGDGDTGMTVAQVIAAWKAACPTLSDDVGEALETLGREAGRASGSTLASVLAIGLSAAGKQARGRPVAERKEVADLLSSAVDAVMSRSGARLGGKTVLDSLTRIGRDLRTHCDTGLDSLEVAIRASRAALEEYRPRQSELGRARIYGRNSISRDDPGMLAANLLLDALR